MKLGPESSTPVILRGPFCAHSVSSQYGEKRRVGGSGHSEATVVACPCAVNEVCMALLDCHCLAQFQSVDSTCMKKNAYTFIYIYTYSVYLCLYIHIHIHSDVYDPK